MNHQPTPYGETTGDSLANPSESPKRKPRPKNTRDKITAIHIGRKPKNVPHCVRIAQLTEQAKEKIVFSRLKALHMQGFVLVFVVKPREFINFQRRAYDKCCRLMSKPRFTSIRCSTLDIHAPTLERPDDPTEEELDRMDEEQFHNSLDEDQVDFNPEDFFSDEDLSERTKTLQRFWRTKDIIQGEQFERIIGAMQLRIGDERESHLIFSEKVTLSLLISMLADLGDCERDILRLRRRLYATCDEILRLKEPLKEPSLRFYAYISPKKCEE